MWYANLKKIKSDLLQEGVHISGITTQQYANLTDIELLDIYRPNPVMLKQIAEVKLAYVLRDLQGNIIMTDDNSPVREIVFQNELQDLAKKVIITNSYVNLAGNIAKAMWRDFPNVDLTETVLQPLGVMLYEKQLWYTFELFLTDSAVSKLDVTDLIASKEDYYSKFPQQDLGKLIIDKITFIDKES